MGTPLDWLELVGFIMNTPVYVVVSGVTALVTQEPMRFPIILEKLGDGVKEEITHIYEERGYVNGSLYVVGELLPLLLGTKGLGATTKAAEETAQAAKILKEAKTAFAATTLKETEAAVKAAEAVEAARLLEMKNLLEDMTVWKNQPVLVTQEGVPIGRQFTFAEIRVQQMEARALEKAALESEGYGIMGVDDIAATRLRGNVAPEVIENGKTIKTFTHKADPVRDVLGPGRESHPEEWNRMIKELEENGVEVRYREGTMAYGPHPSIKGEPGQIIIDPDASISALEHEYAHFLQAEKSGFPNMRESYTDKAARIARETDSYAIEIQRAKDLGLDNVVQQLEKNLVEEINLITGN
ncbi:MAG: hypothetical protein FWF88_06245 [Peptococcaceae bacterium]|nr:hypothetical protein [Peptococcaceae bacterium]